MTWKASVLALCLGGAMASAIAQTPGSGDGAAEDDGAIFGPVAPAPGGAEVDPLKECDDCPQMALVPGGPLTMGPRGAEIYVNAQTTIEVTLAGFLIGAHEVSIDEWLACRDDGVCPASRVNIQELSGALPVTGITRADIDVYLAWLNAQTGGGYRLPSEAEWEAAALAGSEAIFPWGDTPDRVFGNFGPLNPLDAELGAGKLLPVDSQKPNALGIYGMIGNALELTGDCYLNDLGHLPRDGAVYEVEDCKATTAKGGDYLASALFVRPRFRFFVPVEDSSPRVGFRVARSLPEAIN